MATPAAVPSPTRRRAYGFALLFLLMMAVLGVTLGPVRIGPGSALLEIADRCPVHRTLKGEIALVGDR